MSRAEGSSSEPSTSTPPPSTDNKRDKDRIIRTLRIFRHTHQNDAVAVRKLLEEDASLVNFHDYDNRTPLHVAALHGWIDVGKCLLEFGADVNAQDRWKNTELMLLSDLGDGERRFFRAWST